MRDGPDEIAACLRDANRVVTELLSAIDWTLLNVCRCGHRRFEHLPGREHPEGREPCAHRSCRGRAAGCGDFETREVEVAS